MEQLLAEAASLAEQGVKELILVAQETTLYGVDLYGKKSLHILLKELAKIKGIRWIRILYCYPEEIYPELIETIKNEKKSVTIWTCRSSMPAMPFSNAWEDARQKHS